MHPFFKSRMLGGVSFREQQPGMNRLGVSSHLKICLNNVFLKDTIPVVSFVKFKFYITLFTQLYGL